MSIIGKVIAAEPLVLMIDGNMDESANSEGPPDMSAYGSGFVALLSVGFMDGDNPTISCRIQESDDGGTWTDVAGGVFTLVTNAAIPSVQSLDLTRTKTFLRASWAIGGDAPAVPFSVLVIPVSEPRRPQVVLHLPPGTHAEIR